VRLTLASPSTRLGHDMKKSDPYAAWKGVGIVAAVLGLIAAVGVAVYSANKKPAKEE